jgi:hypothetical protein
MKSALKVLSILLVSIASFASEALPVCHPAKETTPRQSSDSGSDSGVGVGFFRQKESPLVLIATNHGVEDVLLQATVLNVSQDKISSYRLGWRVKCGDNSSQVMRSKLVSFPSSLPPQQKRVDGPFEVPGSLLNSGTVDIRFFVAEVQFENGKIWSRHQED